jgi:hypothetical protein
VASIVGGGPADGEAGRDFVCAQRGPLS